MGNDRKRSRGGQLANKVVVDLALACIACRMSVSTCILCILEPETKRALQVAAARGNTDPLITRAFLTESTNSSSSIRLQH